MDLGVFTELGFTFAEAKVYVTLLRCGSVKVGKIIEKSGLQSSTVHNTLHSLIDKGFVTYVLKGKIKLYSSVDPKLVLKSFKDKEEKFEKMLPKLNALQAFSGERQSAEVYEGFSGIITMLNELIGSCKPGDTYYFFSADVVGRNEEIQKFYEVYDAKRKARKVVVKGIAREHLRCLYTHRTYLKMRYVDFPTPSNCAFCNGKIAFITWGEKPTGILIVSEQMAEKQIAFFNELWKKGGR